MQKEHILVCLSSSPSNPKVIKTGAKMAESYNAKFSALYIETSTILNKDDKKRLEDNLNLAKDFGAKICTLSGNDIPYQVSNYARMAGVTKIVIGRSGEKSNSIFTPPGFVDKLIGMVPDIEIFIIPDKAQKLYLKRNYQCELELPTITFKDSVFSIIILLLFTIFALLFYKLNFADSNIIMMYIIAILTIAYKTQSSIYSFIASFLSVIIYNFCFIEPYSSLHFNNKNYLLTFIIMFVVAFVAASITKKVKTQAREASLRTYRTETLLELSQRLQQCSGEVEINEALKEQLKRLLLCDVCIYTDYKDNESSVLEWVFKNNKTAGYGTKNFKDEDCFYVPVGNSESIFSVVAINKKDISEFEKNLISAMTREAALAYEKYFVTKLKNELILKNKQEELRSTLLRAISHDLRTPLTGISGYAELLIKNSERLSESKRVNIYTDIYEDSIWLLKLVENLLYITRFDNDSIVIKQELEFLPDIINDAVLHLGKKKENYNIKTIFSDENLYAKMDAGLIAHVILNLVDNAIKYSPENSTIIVRATRVGSDIEVSVEDEGNGIADEDKAKIFDLFYTVRSSTTDSRRGLGLGLALCKSIIKAHSSEIIIRDNIPVGTVFSFKLKGDFYE